MWGRQRRTRSRSSSEGGGSAAALSRETFQKIRRIQIRTRTLLESGIVGSYHAVFKGRGMEFAEVREYEPGDEVRLVLCGAEPAQGNLLPFALDVLGRGASLGQVPRQP